MIPFEYRHKWHIAKTRFFGLNFCRRKYTCHLSRLRVVEFYWHKQRYRVFVPPFEGLRGNVHGSPMARWKARGRLPISANWTFFASYYGWGAMSRYRALSLPGQFAPRSESANKTLANSLSGPFAPWNFRSLERNGPALSLLGTKNSC